MTCCVASLCDNRKAIVLAADKMVGLGMIESEPNIKKILRVHRDWWVMLAGNDVSPAFDIVDSVKRNLAHKSVASVEQASRVVSESYKKKRAEIAEATHLVPLGWTLKQFNSRSSIGVISDATRTSIGNLVANYSLSVCLLVAGFDSHGQGHVFSVDDDENRGDACRHDIPGYHAIGSGGYGATYMMAYRELSPVMPIREMLYYVAEGKYFGELASGVGTRTDLYVIRFGKPHVRIKEEAVDEKLMKLCARLKPRNLGKDAISILNSFQGTKMDTIPKLKLKIEGKERVIST